MSILQEIREIKSERRDLRNFGLVVGSVLLALGAYAAYRGAASMPWLLGTGGTLCVLGLVLPTVLMPLQKVWMALSVVMGWVMTRLILSVLFYGVVTPLALVMRMFGKRFMPVRPDPKASTYWQPRPGGLKKPESYEKQF